MSAHGLKVSIVADGLINAMEKDGISLLDDTLGKNVSQYVRDVVSDLDAPSISMAGLRGKLMGLVAEAWVHGKSEAQLGEAVDYLIESLRPPVSHQSIAEWIESKSTLHTYVEILYAVTGYEVSVTNDRIGIDDAFAYGDTVEEAFAKIMKECP